MFVEIPPMKTEESDRRFAVDSPEVPAISIAIEIYFAATIQVAKISTPSQE